MAGVVALVAGIVIAIFLGGAVFGVIVLVAIKVKSEDKATMGREDRSLTLREVAPGAAANGIRKLTGVGLRIEDSGR